MAPRTPVDLDNPSWGDWLRGNIKYGERKAADFNDWWATRTENDKLPDREKFLDAMRNDPNANNGWAAFEIGARNLMDKGGFFGPAFKAAFMPDPASPEAMRKMDYASGQLNPAAHLAGAGVGTAIAVADSILSGKAAKTALSGAKSGLGWLGGRLGLGSAVEAGPIGAWTNAATGARSAPSAASQALSWLGEKGSSLSSALSSALPVTTKIVTNGAVPAAAVTAGGLGTNALINFIDGTPAKFEQQRQQEAAAAQQAANQPQDSSGDQQFSPESLDTTIAQFLDQMEPPEIKARYDLNPNDPVARAAYEQQAFKRAANTRTAREAIAVGRAIGLDPETTLALASRGMLTNNFINNMMGYTAQQSSRAPTLKDVLGAQQMEAIAKMQNRASKLPEGSKERSDIEAQIEAATKELMQFASSSYDPLVNAQLK